MTLVALVISSCNNNKDYKKSDVKLTTLISNGTSKVLGATIDGKKEGMWIKYDDSGRISSSYTYIHDHLFGEEINYWENGKIASKHKLIGDEIQGLWVTYFDYDKNKIAEKGNYKDGNKIGIWEYYIEDGRINKKIEYTSTGKKILFDNHLVPVNPDKNKPSQIDTNNRVYITDKKGNEIVQ